MINENERVWIATCVLQSMIGNTEKFSAKEIAEMAKLAALAADNLLHHLYPPSQDSIALNPPA